MKMRQIALVCVLIFATCPVLADRGVVLTQGINLKEPAQRAIVMHNGTWEVLILQTDIQADRPTHAVEFMPLPSNPEVFLASDQCFKNLQTLINKYDMKYIIGFTSRGPGGQRGKNEGIKVVGEHNIGPHNVTVVEIQNVDAFRSWVIDFFTKNALSLPILTDDLNNLVADYCNRGFCFMVFDVLDLSEGQKTVAPLVYRFKCDHAYYPLKITNLYGGKGTIEVFYAFHPWRDDDADCPDPDDFDIRRPDVKGKPWVYSRKVRLSTAELKTLDPEAEDLFGDTGAWFFATKYDGDLQFDDDIWLSMGYDSPTYLCRRFISFLQEGDIESLEFLLTCPFALNRQQIYEKAPEALVALKEFIKQHDLKDFHTNGGGSFTGIYRSEFDKLFIEKYPKEQRWEHLVFDLDKSSLHFLVCRLAGASGYRIASFRISSLYDFSY